METVGFRRAGGWRAETNRDRQNPRRHSATCVGRDDHQRVGRGGSAAGTPHQD